MQVDMKGQVGEGGRARKGGPNQMAIGLWLCYDRRIWLCTTDNRHNNNNHKYAERKRVCKMSRERWRGEDSNILTIIYI